MAFRRPAGYWIIGLALVTELATLQRFPIFVDGNFNIVLETTTTVLALVVGALALMSHYARNHTTLLILGAAFIGVGLLDGYQAVVESGLLAALLPSTTPSPVPWSWFASQTYLSAMFVLSWLLWRRDKIRGTAFLVSAKSVYLFTAGATLLSALLITFVPLPQFEFPALFFPRPIELVPALLFLVALVGHYRKGYWRRDAFEHWLVLSLIVSAASEVVLASASGHLAEASINVAHLFKAASYVCILTGLAAGVSAVFRDASQTTITLAQANVSLKLEALDRQRAEQELRIAKDLADQANSAKSDFLSSMSHELRTPLNSILGFSQLLSTDPDADLSRDQIESVGQISRAGHHLLDLINEILDLSKIEAGAVSLSLEGVKIGPIFDSVLSLTEPLAAARGIRVDTGYEQFRDLIARADVTRLRQVLLNLLSNAVKYNVENGQLKLSCEVTAADRIRVSVQDSGRGFSGAQIEQVFDPFTRLAADRAKIEGTGIGLTITKRLVEMMDGEIGVTSEVDIGSTFWFELPRADDQTKVVEFEDAQAEVPVRAEPGATRRILYVEDNPSNLRLMELIVGRRTDLELISAHTAEIGIKLARTEAPDVILMDINLPGMSGLEALEFLRAHESTRQIPVIAVSANATARDIEKGKEFGFLTYLTKPLDVNEVLEAIDATPRV